MKRWQPDALLPGFEALELEFPADYDGPVVSTLVRLPTANAPRGAVLYIRGFSDYFFQRHMAERFAAEGYAFYALDLRKYGRSLRAHQHANFCKSVSEYYAEIDAAIAYVAGEALLGIACPLSVWEAVARGGTPDESFIGRWVRVVLFYRAPEWVFTTAYVAWGLATLATLRLVPPRRKAR